MHISWQRHPLYVDNSPVSGRLNMACCSEGPSARYRPIGLKPCPERWSGSRPSRMGPWYGQTNVCSARGAWAEGAWYPTWSLFEACEARPRRSCSCLSKLCVEETPAEGRLGPGATVFWASYCRYAEWSVRKMGDSWPLVFWCGVCSSGTRSVKGGRVSAAICPRPSVFPIDLPLEEVVSHSGGEARAQRQGTNSGNCSPLWLWTALFGGH